MRKWTTSACLVVASVALPLVAAAGWRGPAVPQLAVPQASTSIASITSINSSTQAPPAATRTTVPVLAAVTTAAVQATAEPAGTWTVRPGDTLSSIAAALAVPGGWPALYALNKQVIGPRPNLINAGAVLALPVASSYTIAPGDTLASIAAALAVPGGWPALYAANRRVIGPDPDRIHAGSTLALPGQAAGQGQAAAQGQGQGASLGYEASHNPAGGSPEAPATPQATATAGTPTARAPIAPQAPASGDAIGAAAVMPRWLKLILLIAGLLTLTSFLIEPAAVLTRRRRAAKAGQAAHAAVPVASPAHREERAASASGGERPGKSKIIQATHDRLIVTYSAHYDTVYLLTPPGEDPWSVLRAARVVVPEQTYVDLADHLGVPSVWPYE